ncbi:cysteine--tRNA ligase [bacterium]|nr:cysteine--tRNA ligase [candidate division CSSED10-310 bacterium]
MAIRRKLFFTDTLSGNKREFVPMEKDQVKIYSCGPTVYDYAHIGNFRNFVFVDVLRRSLKLFGYVVTHVMNITDVDDKIIRDAKKEGVSTDVLAKRYTDAFFEDCRFLRLEPVEYNPKATEHINEMVDLVKRLIDAGMTYEVDGSIYFRISKFKDYGKLSKIDLDRTQAGLRIDSDEYDKEDVRDFVLWKAYKEGEPFWDVPVGKGRPGWHLECSAMSAKYLGRTFDIHTGAEDLIFPHHENEIAQSEAAFGQTFVRYWLHCAFLNMKTQKMSKSLGNIVTVHNLAKTGVNPLAVRYFLLSVHYRKPLIFSDEAIDAAGSAVDRLRNFYRRLSEISQLENKSANVQITSIVSKCREDFLDGLADDLNTAKSLGAVFEMVRQVNPLIESQDLTSDQAKEVISLLQMTNKILDILDDPQDVISEEIETLIEKRQEARKQKNFAMADKLRDELLSKGVVLEDTREGVRWYRKQ